MQGSALQTSRDHGDFSSSIAQEEHSCHGDKDYDLGAFANVGNSMSEGSIRYRLDGYSDELSDLNVSSITQTFLPSHQGNSGEILQRGEIHMYQAPYLATDTNPIVLEAPPSVQGGMAGAAETRGQKRGPLSDMSRILPPKRRGGRKGGLSTAQRESLRQARKDGVCIRCHFTRIKVSISTAVSNHPP